MLDQLIKQLTELDEEYEYVPGENAYAYECVSNYNLEEELNGTQEVKQKIEKYDDFIRDPQYQRQKHQKPSIKDQNMDQNQTFEERESPFQNEQQCEQSCLLYEKDKNSEITEGVELAQETNHEAHPTKSKSIRKQNRKQLKKRDPYPTKNFLQTFKPCFLTHLAQCLGRQHFDNHPLLSSLSVKTGINLKDYQSLFKRQELRPFLQGFFEKKILYRQLMMSRIAAELKKIYFKRIHIFEEGFLSGNFTHINSLGIRVAKMA